jgi:hypothetical protein
MHQEFKPVAITGSPSSRAHALAEDIAGNDYHVADMSDARREGDVPKVRYKDNAASVAPSSWGAAEQTIQQAIAAGRETRVKYGSGLDILQANIKSGAEPDLIELSKRRSPRIY